MKILIVDDVADNTFLLSTYLKAVGADTESVETGIRALELLELTHFDIIILDIQMPFLDGWQTAKILREQGFKGTIIACSAIGYSQHEFHSVNRDFDAYLPKPVLKNDLIDCLYRQSERIS